MNSWTELDLGKLAGNIARVKAAVSSSSEIIFVVKANAYGHGLKAVAECAWSSGLRWFAVAHFNEANALRAVLPEARILIVGAIDPATASGCAEGGFVPVLVSEEHGLAVSRQLGGRVLECHAKVDTGMGRLGIAWQDAADVVARLRAEKNLNIAGICTHYASSDGDSRSFFDEQRRRFAGVLQGLCAKGIRPGFRHASNSGAVALEPDSDLDGVRPGIMIYGYGRSAGPRPVGVEPVLQWKTRVVQVKHVPAGFPVGYDSTFTTPSPTNLATVDVGYSDGYPRALSSRGTVLIGGRRCPVVGRVTMNLITVDAGADSSAGAGDEVVLIGRQGGEQIWADEIAGLCGTISYEILTGIRAGSVKVVL